MAQLPNCDICTTEPAVQMLTNMADGTTMALGAACLPEFYGQSLLLALEAGQHHGPAGKCQACRRVHERLTIPAAPAPASTDTAGTTPADDLPAEADTVTA